MHNFMLCGLLYSFCLLAFGCASTDVDQACRPELRIGCEDESFCSIFRNGEAVCLPRTIGRLPEGSLCESFDSIEDANTIESGVCAPGLGCVQDGIYKRCLRFCETSNPDVKTACQNLIDADLAHRYGELSECTMRVQGRNEIGLCKLPCEFGKSGETAGCPVDSTCGLTPDSYSASCRPEGIADEGQSCDASCPCAPGLVCLPEVGINRCRQARTVSGCGDTHFGKEVHGTRDMLVTDGETWSPYAYCARCVQLSIRVDDGPIWLCAGEQGCEDQDVLASLNGMAAEDVALSIGRYLGREFAVVVNLEQRDNLWFWSDGTEPVEVESIGSEALCPTILETGRLQIQEQCPDFHLCRVAKEPYCAVEGE